MKRRWIRIGAGLGAGITTILGLFAVLSMLYGFEITDLTGDFACEGTYENPCISRFLVKNPNNYVVDIYSKEQVKLDFSPDVKDYALFVPDGRCSAEGSCRCDLEDGSKIGFKGWRCVDFTNKTKPRSDKVYNFRFDRYSTTEFMLVGIKNNPEDRIKWGIGVSGDNADAYLDPIWEGTYDTDIIVDLGNNQSDLSFAINYSKLDWSSITDSSGNWTWNLSESDVGSYNTGNYTFNITNNNSANPINVSMKIDRKAYWYELYCNNTLISTDYTRIIDNLGSNESAYINCTMDFNDIQKGVVDWYDILSIENMTSYWRLDSSGKRTVIDWEGNNTGTPSGYSYNDGTLYGNTTINSTYGKYGKGMGFDGDGDYVNTTYTVHMNDSFSISMWAKRSGGSSKGMISKYMTTGNNREWLIKDLIDEIDFIYSEDGTSGTISQITTNNNCGFTNYDTWTHFNIDINYDDNNISFFKNGDFCYSEISQLSIADKGMSIIVGAQQSNSNHFNGSLDNILIFNRSLTQSEITKLYNNQTAFSPVTDSLILQYTGDGIASNSTHIFDQNNLGAFTVYNETFGSGMSFDGDGDHVDSNFNPDSELGDGNPFTLSFWAKPTGSSTYVPIGNQIGEDRFYFAKSSVWYFGIGNSSVTGTGATAIADTWQYVVYVFEGNGNNVRVYVNDIQKYNSSYLGDGDFPDSSAFIGAYDYGGASFEFDGSLDEVMIFNRSLTGEEITALYGGYDRTQFNYEYEFKKG